MGRRDFSKTAAVPLWAALVVLCAGMTGCATTTTDAAHPVDNPIPDLKPGVYTMKTVDAPPVATTEVQPDYPRELGGWLEGKAFVAFTVTKEGKVTDASTVRADDVLFGEAAVTAILKWKFRPAQLHGDAVDCRMTMPFYFSNPYGFGLNYTPMPGQSGSPPEAPNTSTSIQRR